MLLAESGSEACASCHPAIAKSYRATAMARSSGPLMGANIEERFASTTAGSAHVAREGGRVVFTIGDKVRRTLDFFVGSGLVGRSYLSSVGGYLFQAPVSYYSAAQRWDLSPGFEKQNEMSLTRAVEMSCLRCHTSRLRPVAGTVNQYQSPPFLEGGVSCERCHGDGDGHIAAMKSPDRTGGLKIVNPVKLDPVRRDSVCAQCHLAGAVEIAKKGAEPYRPGKALAESSTVFVWSDPGSYMANSHFERMAQSKCRQASAGKMWCGTCHDPHTRPAEAQKVSFFRDRCLTCHTLASCPTKKENCIQCHMPRTEMSTVRHSATTDHSIPRSPRQATGAASNNALIAFEGVAGERELGLAYADIGLRDNNRQWGMRAFELLRKAYAADPDDTKVAGQLAQLYDRMGNSAKACEIYEAIVAADSAAIAPAVNLGACLAKQGQVTRSIELWTGVLKRNPGLESARTNLAVALAGSGDAEAAKAVVREGLRFDPLSQRLQNLLRQFEAKRLD